MATIRRNDLIASIALGFSLAFGTQSFGQIINGVPLELIENRIENRIGALQTVTLTVQAARQHLGSGPIDMNNLPPDILNCDVCRQRLGLPPLSSALSANANASPSAVKSPVTNSMQSRNQRLHRLKVK